MALGRKEAVVETPQAAAPRDPDILRAAASILGALWLGTQFKENNPTWAIRCDLALDEAEKLVAAYDARRKR